MQSISILLEEKIIRKHRTYIIRKSELPQIVCTAQKAPMAY